MDKRTAEALARLQETLDELRVKCPWDREQTTESLREHTLEEVCELAEAIDERSPEHIKEELGDLLLHVFFYSKIASEQSSFTLADVADGITAKLIHRHPHVFADVDAKTTDQVLRNWETLKMREGKKRRTKLQKFFRRVRFAWVLVRQ